MVARGAEHVPDPRQERGELRQFTADQDGSDRRGVQRGHRARHQRQISEGSGQNLFLVRDEVLYTPPLSAAVLPGITRNSILQIARDLGFKIAEEPLPRELLYISDEAFFVGTAAEVTPIRSVDKVTIGRGSRGPITEAIQKAFFAIVNGEVPDRHGWLKFVYPGEPLQTVGAAGGAAAGTGRQR